MSKPARFLWYWGPPIVWAAMIFGLSSLTFPPREPSLPWEDKLAHVVLYSTLAILLLRALRGGSGLPLARAALLGFALSSLYGITDEIHQLFTPARSADPADWVADTVGAALAVLVALAVHQTVSVRRKTPSPSNSQHNRCPSTGGRG